MHIARFEFLSYSLFSYRRTLVLFVRLELNIHWLNFLPVSVKLEILLHTAIYRLLRVISKVDRWSEFERWHQFVDVCVSQSLRRYCQFSKWCLLKKWSEVTVLARSLGPHFKIHSKHMRLFIAPILKFVYMRLHGAKVIRQKTYLGNCYRNRLYG